VRLNMLLSRRALVAGSAAFGAYSLTGPNLALAAPLGLEEAMKRRFIGSEDAPVNMIEFFSLGCPACRAFHERVFPGVKEEFIDTGKVRMELRDYPFGVKATAAAMITRCAPPLRYYGLVELMLQSQPKWANIRDSLPPLKQIARYGGMSSADVDACLGNVELMEAIRDRTKEDEEEYDIKATPTFIIGRNNRRIEGVGSLDLFREILNEELG